MASSPHYREVSLKPTVAVLYGDAGAAAMIDALKHWRKEHAPQASYEAMFGEYVQKAVSTTTIEPEGRASIHIVIRGHSRRSLEQYFYEATMVAGELRLKGITYAPAPPTQLST
jgi:hypothetical protein